jgi:hypothetical protein
VAPTAFLKLLARAAETGIVPAEFGNCIAGLNILAAIIVYWNTWKLGEIVARMAEAGEAPPSDVLAHISPLG